ncbi:glycosyltransferase family 39 protein [Conexibacter arvalis]|uniref:Putative membrane protein n=1 Tax=Conexibacter arvalis TaxID=912552 RepID=A0A840ID22_9ACTN|nr:glycosyltransferase family 39 protein [Conexibacter arvalis]MBB4661938.1 putative membrane protein [Conexibacter arvalis]
MSATTTRAPAEESRSRGAERPQTCTAAGARRSAVRALAGEQLGVAAGQLAAGAGNLAFSLLAARLLAPGAFAELAAFLALYLLLHMPLASLSAGGALAPDAAAAARRRLWRIGALAGLAIAIASPLLSAALKLPPAIVLALAAAAPAAGPIALERGRLYGLGRGRGVVASLLAEPAVRLTLGVVLAAPLGATGGALGVAAAGWAGLLVAWWTGRAGSAPSAPAPAPPAAAPHAGAAPATRASGAGAPADARRAWSAVSAFLLLAVVQSQDVLFAQALLPGGEAGRFAVVSALGGIAAFATTTVPLMLLPRAAAGDRRALPVALGVAALLGAGATAVAALAPPALLDAAFGDDYIGIDALVGPYVGAMALLGVARVLVADACARGRGRTLLAPIGAAVALQALLLATTADDAAGIARATVTTAALLTAALAASALPGARRRTPATAAAAGPTATVAAAAAGAVTRLPGVAGAGAAAGARGAGRRVASRARDPIVLALATATAVALGLRLLALRGIWLDEATSIHQAQMGLGEMLAQLRATDVHPPLHHVTLWATVRVIGTGELAVRVPSLLAGTALVPLLYLTARDLWDRRAGLAAAALGAVAPFAVWYSAEARMYAFFMLLALLAVWAQARILRDRDAHAAAAGDRDAHAAARGDRDRGDAAGAPGRLRDWALYALATILLLYDQYFAALVVGVQQAAFALALWSRRRDRAAARAFAIRWLGSAALIVVALIPLIGFAHAQFAANEAAGRGFDSPAQAGAGVAQGGAAQQPSVYGAITNLVWAIWGYHSDSAMAALSALWPFGMLLALLLLGRGRAPRTLLIAAVAVVPAAALFAIGMLKPALFEVRYFIAAVPMLLLLVARALTSWATGRAATVLLVGAFAATLGAGLLDQQVNGANPRLYDFRGALEAVERRAGPHDVLIYNPDYLTDVIGYYAPELNAQPMGRDLPQRRDATVFVLGSFLDKPTFAASTGGLVASLRRTRRLVRTWELAQVRVWEFRRR